MKFEQLLKVYWSKNFLFGGRVFSFNTNLKNFFINMKGLSNKSKISFVKRFELNTFLRNNGEILNSLDLDTRKTFNMYLSQLTSINNNINELVRYNLIRLYLIRTFRGRAQALGKPSRGQRTWSNAWNAYKCNRILRLFIIQIKKNNNIKKTPEKINFKRVKRKVKKTPIRIKMLITKKKSNLWF